MDKQENQINFFSPFGSAVLSSPVKDGLYNQTPLPNKDNKSNYLNSPTKTNQFQFFITPKKPDIFNTYNYSNDNTPMQQLYDFPFFNPKQEGANNKVPSIQKNLMGEFSASPFRPIMNTSSNRKGSIDRYAYIIIILYYIKFYYYL